MQEQLSYMRGTHTLKGGLELKTNGYDEATANGNLFGSADFTNRYTAVPGVPSSGHAYADFLFGVPTTVSRAFAPITVERRRWTYDFFLQDDWKVTDRLTLNLGLRYDVQPGWYEQHGQMAIFDPTRGQIVVPDDGVARVSALMPTGYVQVVSASSAGLPNRTLIHTDLNNLAPRLGVAYKPFHDANTVIRGGYGIYYDVIPLDPLAGSVPFVINELPFTNTQPAPAVVLPRAFPTAGAAGPSSVGLPRAINTNLQMPYSHQWNATVEHQRWNTGFRASYVVTKGRQMWYQRDINAPVPDGRLYVDKPRPFPQYPSIPYVDNGGSHDYRGVTLEAERRMSHGLFVQMAYTAARVIGNTNEWSNTIENPFDLAREKGHDISTPRHRLATAVMYELPVGHDRRWLNRTPRAVDLILGGWQVSAVGYQQTGVFLTPTISIPDPTGTRFTSGANRPVVAIRPDQLHDASLSDPTIDRWFDPTAFAVPALGSFGSASRGAIEGPGINVWHAGIHKTLRVSERAGSPLFRVELTATNLFNQPQWGNPNLNVTPTNVAAATIRTTGGATSWQQATARALRLGLRAEW